jgi:hypothetical protein
MKLRVALSVKFLVVLLALPMLRAQEVQAPATRGVVTLPELSAETSRVHPAIKAETQLIVSPKREFRRSRHYLNLPSVEMEWRRSSWNYGFWNLHLYEEDFDDRRV